MTGMTWATIGLGAGVFAVWFSTIWVFHLYGIERGRAMALEDALGGPGWLARGGNPNGTKVEEVALALTLAEATLGKPSNNTRLLAHAAIGAMRTPSREMNEAVVPHLHTASVLPFATYYDVMIEAALNPNPGPDRQHGVTPEGVEAIRLSLEPFTSHINGKGRH